MDPSFLKYLADTGVLAILAWHFLVNMPKIMSQVQEMIVAQQRFQAEESRKDREEFGNRAELIARELRRLVAEAAESCQENSKPKPE
jgi:hypothetical protein